MNIFGLMGILLFLSGIGSGVMVILIFMENLK